jgi:hypothetical protein
MTENELDYKDYSLKKLEGWVHNAISCSGATPQEIYDTIRKTVDEEYHFYKQRTSRCYELLALLNGNGKGHINAYDEYLASSEENHKSLNDSWNYWEESYYPEEYQSTIATQYTDEELNAMCDAAEKQDKVIKWKLPVEVDGISGEYYVQFPDDLMEAANINENDLVEWVDQGDGSFLLKKIK